jgi:tetratricopeptide (TPR) repeat protein
MANKEQATQLEQASKVVKSEESINDLIQLTYSRFQAEPENLNHSRQLAQLYEQLEDLENSIAWYTYVFEAGGRGDTALEKKAGDLTVRKLERELAVAREAGDEATITTLEQQLLEFKLQQARDLVAKYPNENEYHYKLGEVLVGLGQYKEALPELQLGTKQPNVRLQALNLIATCHWKRGMLDLAEKAFRNTKAECIAWDGLKKEVVYNLMSVLREVSAKAETDGRAELAAQKKEEAISEAKEIYEVDLAYRDVSQIVEDSYTS